MKISLLGPVYLKQIEKIYYNYENLEEKSYDLQHQIICKECYGSIVEWPIELEKNGFEVSQYIYNLPVIQKKWASENKFSFNEKNWEKGILEEQLKRDNPQILFIFNAAYFAYGYLNYLKAICPSIRRVITWYGSPMGSETIFKDYDIVFSNSHNLCANILALGVKSIFIPHAFSKKVFKYIDISNNRDIPFSFCGTLNKINNEHLDRTLLIEYLQGQSNLQVWSDIEDQTIWDKLKVNFFAHVYDYIKFIRRYPLMQSINRVIPFLNKWENIEVRPNSEAFYSFKFYRNVNSPCYGLDMFKILSRSKLTLNGHIKHTGVNSVNMRLFEATGMGCCLLTDKRKILHQYFDVNNEICTYSCTEDALEKIKYLQENPKIMKKIGQAGQKRTLAEHTVEKQINILVKNLKKIV